MLAFALIVLFSLVMGGYILCSLLQSHVQTLEGRLDNLTPQRRQQNCSTKCAPGDPGAPGQNGSIGLNGTSGADGVVQITIVGGNASTIISYNTSFASVLINMSDNDTFVSLPGPPGTNGTNGVCAVPCVNGTDGVNGRNGTNGTPGTNGTCTVPCVNGTSGRDGVNGTNGVDARISIIITGQDNDTSIVIYNTSFANLTIIIRDNDTFVSLPGPPGADGAPGKNGTNGVNGRNGTDGINGVNGTCPGSCSNGTTTITFNTVVYVSQNGTDAPSFGTILQPFSTIAYAMSQVEPTREESWTIYLLGQGNIVESQNLSWKPNVNLAALSVDGIGVTFFGEAITLDFDAWNGTGTSTNSITMSNIVFFSNTTILFDFGILGYGGFPTIRFTNCQFGHPGDGQTTRIVSGNAQPTLYTTNIMGNKMYLKDTPIHSVGDRLDYLQMVADFYDSFAFMVGSGVGVMEILSDDDDFQYSIVVRASNIGGVVLDGSHSHLTVDSASLSDNPPLIDNSSTIKIDDRFFQQIQIESEPHNLDPTAIFRADSTTQLLYIPAMTTSEKEAITPSRAGAMVFDTTLGTGSLWNGTAWNSFG